MTPDILLSRIDVSVLYPPYVTKLKQMYQLLLDQGKQFYATSGLRTFEEQDKLYAFGRTDMSRGKVTNAQGGFSNHNFMIATDSAYDKDNAKTGLQPDYADIQYKALADAAKAVGLDPGFYWKSIHDGPHVQLDIGKHGITVSKLRAVYLKNNGGYKAVTAYLNQFDWT